MRVLFVCTGNYYRSRFAEAVFNHHAAQNLRTVRAFSRGLATWMVDGEGDLSRFAREALVVRRIERACTHEMPVSLTTADLEAAVLTIVLDEDEHRPMMLRKFPEWDGRVRYWRVADVDRRAPEDALADIEAQVLELLSSLPD